MSKKYAHLAGYRDVRPQRGRPGIWGLGIVGEFARVHFSRADEASFALVRGFSAGAWEGGFLTLAVGVDCRLLLFVLSRVRSDLISLSLLATVRGGTSFLCQTATKKRSKENAF
jgi:hypothetical protein